MGAILLRAILLHLVATVSPRVEAIHSCGSYPQSGYWNTVDSSEEVCLGGSAIDRIR
jgi:hypothetical protein